jgi:hypothetical protein
MKKKTRKCFHQISYEILMLCNIKPTAISTLSYKLDLKYPTIYRHLRSMLMLEWLGIVAKDGIEPFQDEGKPVYEFANTRMTEKEWSEIRSTFKKIHLRDYLYFTSPIGKEIIDAFNKFSEIQFKVTATHLVSLNNQKLRKYFTDLFILQDLELRRRLSQ